MAIDSPARPRGDQLEAERERLRARLGDLVAGQLELRAIRADIQRREDDAHAAVAEIGRPLGATEAVMASPSGAPVRSFWSFPSPSVAPPGFEQAASRLTTIREEAAPIYAAVAAVDDALAACRSALDRAEAEIAAREARAEQDRAARLTGWVAATRERHLPDWRDRAAQVLARLGLAEG
jgi:hypothetical protein